MADDERDDDAGEPISREEFSELAGAVTELRDAFRGLEAARTPAERSDAQEDVQDAEESLEQTAKRLGVSADTLRASVKAAKEAERKEELRPILVELLEELTKDDDAGDEPKKKPHKSAPANGGSQSSQGRRDSDAGGDRSGANAAGAGSDDDSAPLVEHWGERRISEVLR